MNIQNNVAFKGIHYTVVPSCEFKKAGQDVVRDILEPFAQKKSMDFKMFVGGPNFLKLIGKMMKVNMEDAIKFLKKRGIKVPAYFFDDVNQPLYIVTGKKDLNRLNSFLEERKAIDSRLKEVFTEEGLEYTDSRKMAEVYGEYAAFFENTKAFKEKFGSQIKEINFNSVKGSLNTSE